MCIHSPDWPDDRLSSFPVLSAMVTVSEAEMKSAVGTAVSLSLESAQFAFEKQLEATSASSVLAEFAEMFFPEIFWGANHLALLALLHSSAAFSLCSER